MCRDLYQIFNDKKFKKIVALNITENQFFCNKLPKGELPKIQCYKTGNVLVGIDLCTGEFHVESEKIEEVVPIYDDLFAYRGLDEYDLKLLFSSRIFKTFSKINFDLNGDKSLVFNA